MEHRILEGIDRACVINLDRRPDRLKRFLSRVPFDIPAVERIPAVDGTTLKPSEEIRQLFEGNNHDYRCGVIACVLSHMEIWKSVAQSGPPCTFVMEDDVYFVDDFVSKWNDTYRHLLPESFDLIYLSGGQRVQDTFIPIQDKPQFSRPIYYGGHDSFRTAGYLISPQGARRLIEIAHKEKVQAALDWFLIEHFDDIDVYAPDHFLAFHPFVAEEGSDILLSMKTLEFPK